MYSINNLNENRNLKPAEKKYIVDLINAGLVGESKMVELAALSLARSIKKVDPEVSAIINSTISSFSINGGSFIRSSGGNPVPVDRDSQLEMATVSEPNLAMNPLPVLSESIKYRIESFLEERNKIDVLLEQDIRPSTSLLLTGQPGTGKTMLARYLAASLNKNLIILDLSASISSLMGKTGANLKKVIDYAKKNASVLLFDEFDAIAKKRDDNTDLGEIKRVVNILLMELENWPVSSIFIATSNHPELLDKAIWRRFDHSIEIGMPDHLERLKILQDELNSFLEARGCSGKLLEPISELFEGKSPADICKYANNVKRRIILKNEDPLISMINEIDGVKEDKKLRAQFCKVAKEVLGDKITVRDLAGLTGLSPAGVQHHLSK